MKNITKSELQEFISLGFFIKQKMLDDLGIKSIKYNNGFINSQQNAEIRRYLSIFLGRLKFAKKLIESERNLKPLFALGIYLKDKKYFGNKYYYCKSFWINGKDKITNRKVIAEILPKILLIEEKINELIGSK